ncbi:MAG: RNase H family protein [Actinomycetota bacterium]|nr:RNase H family protein [Actinomycetota bacterium]
MFTCETCGKEFELRQDILDKYPGWTPKQCLDCRNSDNAKKSVSAAAESSDTVTTATKNKDMTTGEVLATFTGGPKTGVFTDGASEGNPGPGGWGAVLVVDDEVVREDYGADGHTTNNRMELTAMIAGLKMVPGDTPVVIYTDSQLVVNILTKWAAGWEAKGWKKKSPGAIKNIELVKEAYSLARARPDVSIQWIRAHGGNRWNEYADALATAYRREEF